MVVTLALLKPNPMRDFKVDPFDEEAVKRLMASIEEDGFWGGVVCRQNGKDIEIAAGHHRVEAAIRLGIEQADLFVKHDMDDATLVRIYARENATQRGTQQSTARAGSVAGALRLAAYEVLMGEVSGFPETSRKQKEQLECNIVSDRGIGAPFLFEHYLKDVPGIKINTINEDLASLKKSGHYARIIKEVRDRINAEREKAEEAVRKAQETAERAEAEERARLAAEAEARAVEAAEAAAKTKVTFDFTGVAAHLTQPEHLRVFRETVELPNVKEYVPLENQAEIARRISEQPGELTGLRIRDSFMGVVRDLVSEERELSSAEEQSILRANWKERFRDAAGMLETSLRRGAKEARTLIGLIQDQPFNTVTDLSQSQRKAIKDLSAVLGELEDVLGRSVINEQTATAGTTRRLGSGRGQLTESQ